MFSLFRKLSIATAASVMLASGCAPVYAATPKAKVAVAQKKATTNKAKPKTVSRQKGPSRAKATKAVHSPRKAQATVRRASYAPSTAIAGAALADTFNRTRGVALESSGVMVVDVATGLPLLEKNARDARPIASISKLMTAMVVLDAKLPMDEVLTIVSDDVDRVKYSSSRLAVGAKLTRREMLRLALMSSENRAAHALGREYPGGMPAFVRAMNDKARGLGLRSTTFEEPTGLSPNNIASPRDLAAMVAAAAQYPVIKAFSTDDSKSIATRQVRHTFHNTNPLVRANSWDIELQKTGYIAEAGRCLVMQTNINDRPTLIVLLDGHRKQSRIQDAVNIKRWLEAPDTTNTLKAADIMIGNRGADEFGA